MAVFPNNVFLLVVYANFVLEARKDGPAARTQLQLALKAGPSTLQRYQIFSTIENSKRLKDGQEGQLDLQSYVEFKRNYRWDGDRTGRADGCCNGPWTGGCLSLGRRKKLPHGMVSTSRHMLPVWSHRHPAASSPAPRAVIRVHKSALAAQRDFWQLMQRGSVRMSAVERALRHLEEEADTAHQVYRRCADGRGLGANELLVLVMYLVQSVTTCPCPAGSRGPTCCPQGPRALPG